MSVRVIVIGSAGIGSNPDSLHPVEQDTVNGVMAQCAGFIGCNPARHRIDDVQSVEGAYPHPEGDSLIQRMLLLDSPLEVLYCTTSDKSCLMTHTPSL